MQDLANRTAISPNNAAIRVHRVRQALKREMKTGVRYLCHPRLPGLPLRIERKFSKNLESHG